jgi:hypothetical protein
MRNVILSCLLAVAIPGAASATVTATATLVPPNGMTLADNQVGAQSVGAGRGYGSSGCNCSLSASSSANAATGQLAIHTIAGGTHGGSGTADASAKITTDLVFSAVDASKTSNAIFSLSDISSAVGQAILNESLTFTLSGGFGTQSFTQTGSFNQDYAFSFMGPSAMVHLELVLQGGSKLPSMGDELTSNATIRLRTTNASFGSTDGFLSAVPEPASWAIMVAGFGLVGAAIRRRRATEMASA